MKRKLTLIFSFLAIFFLMAIGSESRAASGEYTVYLPLVVNGDTTGSPTIDGVPLEVTSSFLPGEFESSASNDINQISTAFLLNPFREFSIVSAPYGAAPPIEALPDSVPGGADIYRTALADYRTQQGGTPQPAPSVSLFSQLIPGSYSILNLITDSKIEQSTLIVEWVVEAESRLWIIRIARDLSDGTNPSVFLESLQGLSIEVSNTTVEQPSSKAVQPLVESSGLDGSVNLPNTLPVPPWWSGNCNVNNHSGSLPLGATYDGLIACGPLGSAQLVHFFPGAVGEYEWQCVELAMRYLYLKYNIPPYLANGKDVVNNMPPQYIGSLFEQITNGTPNHAPAPGDVLSFYKAGTNGHVAIVTATNVDSNGDGSIEIIEQNWSQNGHRSLPITSWQVGGSMSVTNWLHSISSSSPTPTKTPTSTLPPTATKTPTPSFTPTPTNTFTSTPTKTSTNTSTPTITLTPTASNTSTDTPTPTITPTPTFTNTPTPTDTPTIGSWQEVGAGSASGGGISNTGYSSWPSLALAPDGTSYVAWYNYDTSTGYDIYVLAWNGSSWAEVGAGSASGGGISNTGRSFWPSLALAPDGTPYVAWMDDSNSKDHESEIYVRVWNGSSWAEVGAGSASGGGISNDAGESQNPSLAISPEGTPYIAWWDFSSGDYEIYLRVWNGSSWAEVGAGSASGGGISNTGYAHQPSLALDPDGTPYVAWNDNSSGNSEIYLRAWNGSSWAEVGAGSASDGGISNTGYSLLPSLAIAPEGTPYVAWWDISIGNSEIYVRAWNGSSWVEVGIGSASGGGISNNNGESQNPSLAIAPDGTPYVAWSDISIGNFEIYVRAWNGSSWVEVGIGSASSGGISNNTGASRVPSLAIATDGTPYVAWYDDSSEHYEIYVRRYIE